ncbi:MAG: hypothetical protein KGL39_30540 [Patescibacteria group bacterium]|nr:hypothetical protein [Patescibacteria group bacterium]
MAREVATQLLAKGTVDSTDHMDIVSAAMGRMNDDDQEAVMDLFDSPQVLHSSRLYLFGRAAMLGSRASEYASRRVGMGDDSLSDMYSDDLDVAKVAAIGEWQEHSQSIAGIGMQYAARNLGANAGSQTFVHIPHNLDFGANDRAPTSPRLAAVMQHIYDTTQAWYAAHKKEPEYVTVYRGVSHDVVTHQPLESWTTSKRVARSFMGMDETEGTLFRAKLPKSGIFMSYKASPIWNEAYRREQEIVVLSGALKDVHEVRS